MSRARIFLAVAVVAAAAMFSLSGKWPWPRVRETVQVADAPPPPPKPTHTESSDTLHRGETLSELLGRNGIVAADLSGFAEALDPRRLRAGLVFNFRKPIADSIPDLMTVRTSPEQRLMMVRVADGWDTEVETIAWEPQVFTVSGTINHSLYEALDREVADSILGGEAREHLAWALAAVYQWAVDFTRDTREGDHFNVVIERLVSEEGDVRFGRVLASELSINGRELPAFRFEGHFFDDDGNSLKRAFLRAPVEFRRISSNFSRARFHPVLGRTRKHEGTDYAANTGTPVMAAGDGTVIRAGRAGGYGNMIEIRHRNGITTRYAHLSRILTKVGARVTQGQQIGKVGATGLASGPHLHYEFRVNGVAKDSRKVELGNGAPVEKSKRAAFEAERESLQRLLDGGPAPDSAPPGAAPALVAQASSRS